MEAVGPGSGGALQPLACRAPCRLPVPGRGCRSFSLCGAWWLGEWGWLGPNDGGHRRGWPGCSMLQRGERTAMGRRRGRGSGALVRAACLASRRGPSYGLSWGHSPDLGVFGSGGWPSGAQGNKSVLEGPDRLTAWAGAVIFPPSFLQLSTTAPHPVPARLCVLSLRFLCLSGMGDCSQAEVLKYLGKPPSHLCSGFFSELRVFLL